MVAVRAAPFSRSRTLGHKCHGEAVLVREVDETGIWCCTTITLMDGTEAFGWVPMSHPLLGPLLVARRRDAAARVRHLCTEVMSRDMRAVRLSLKNGADPMSSDDCGRMPLLEALEDEDLSIVAPLLLHRADPNIRSYPKHGILRGELHDNGSIANSMRGHLDCLDEVCSDAVRTLIHLFRGDEVSEEACNAVLSELPLDLAGVIAWTLSRRSSSWKRVEGAERALLTKAVPECRHERDPRPRRYEVRNFPLIAVRHLPSMQADVMSTRAVGQILELHDWDPSGCWRSLQPPSPRTQRARAKEERRRKLIEANLLTATARPVPEVSRSNGGGWVPVEHPLLGALLLDLGPL
eukprot:gnl/TRDRNA2_/TRDRNA2_175023_c0_seq1.p1 gnl/TRDRNA2_/TRDRNA2_175023_c0~~gnl/TRDRNA2_/TRDRNA2_175023_c0_seq1.p1  ORF type:complete len:405 (-),score=43.17 gnl/TRDRNA2_/TRDRNA2_175023_c0_seq1:33-1085(-)